MIESWKQFFNLTETVRHCQKEYFKTKSAFWLERSKAKEAELDDCIEYQKQKWAKAQQNKIPF